MLYRTKQTLPMPANISHLQERINSPMQNGLATMDTHCGRVE